MHGFNHAPTNNVNSVFPKVVQHFAEIKRPLTTFEICHNSALFQQMEDCYELHELFLAFYKVPIRNLLSHRSLPMKSSILPLILNMLARQTHVILINNHP